MPTRQEYSRQPHGSPAIQPYRTTFYNGQPASPSQNLQPTYEINSYTTTQSPRAGERHITTTHQYGTVSSTYRPGEDRFHTDVSYHGDEGDRIEVVEVERQDYFEQKLEAVSPITPRALN
jgi:hypothetical protein